MKIAGNGKISDLKPNTVILYTEQFMSRDAVSSTVDKVYVWVA